MTYPALFLRVKAMLIDSTILGVLFMVLIILSSELGITDAKLKAAFVLIPVVLFEPLLIWVFGGNIGHQLSGIKIVGANSGKNLFVINGIVRLLTKTLLGLFSLLSMLITKRHRSIHDVLSRSVVVFKDEAAAPSSHKLSPRENPSADTKPSFFRKLIVIAVYLVITLVIMSILVSATVSGDCVEFDRCNDSEIRYLNYLVLGFLVGMLLIIILGFMNKLPGGYYRQKK